MTQATFQEIALSAIRASKTNPRKTFPQTSLEELSRSIQEMGMAQPILVRLHPEEDEFVKYEIVAGERRYRASVMANLSTIPCMVRNLTDLQTLELQVIENLQREDVHPLEEADGYDRLMKLHGVNADQLVDKVKKSRSYVYGRLKLLELEPDSRQAFYDGKLNPSTALLIARIPKVLQEKAVKEITEPRFNSEEPMSFRDAKNHLQRRYMLQLDAAPFDTTIETLIFDVGSCAQCPKRTGNQPELFSDIESTDVCTDPDCFGLKKEAYIVFQIDQAAQTGQQVIEGENALEIKPEDWSDFEDAGYAALDESCMDDEEQRTFREILGDACPTPILFKDPHEDEATLIEIVKLSDIEHILKEKIIQTETPQNGKTAENSAKKANDQAAAQRKREEEAKKERQAREKLFHAVRNQLNGDLTLDIRRLIAKILVEGVYASIIPKLHGWKENILQHPQCHKALPESIDKLNEKQINTLLIDLVMVDDLTVYSHNMKDSPKRLYEAAVAAGINPLTLKSIASKGKSASKPAGVKATPANTWPFPVHKKATEKPAPAKTAKKPAAKKTATAKKTVKPVAKPKAKAARKK